MIENITLAEMRACIAVGNTLSFTEAGKLIESVKSRASILVKRYENNLGFEVFGRTTRRVHPTVPGRNLLPSIRAAIRYWDKQVAKARAKAQETQGTLLKNDEFNPQLSQIARLIAVAETGSITKAATELHMSKSYMSKLVAVFEDELGFRLFERGTRMAFRATPAGRVFISSARAFLQFCNDRHQWAQVAAEKRHGGTEEDRQAHLKMLEEREEKQRGELNRNLRRRLAQLIPA